MKTAKKLLDNHDTGKFYDEVLRALWGYVGDKFNMSQESLNKDTLDELMSTIDSFAKKAGKTVKELIKEASDAYKQSDAEDIIEEEFKDEEH